MPIYKYLEHTPLIGSDTYFAPGSVVIGRAQISDKVNVWFNCVIRADVNFINIGEGTNIQDLSMLHVTEVHPLIIGSGVTIGHSVILHGCEIGDGSLIGMGAKVLDGAIIGKNCLVAAGSIIPPGKSYPDGSFIMGTPAKIIKELNSQQKLEYSNHFKSYVKLAQGYLGEGNLRELDRCRN
jgi:carbonic anhydrase/acetyltransferase-like protein (isoleucine patch superfamily)